MTRTSSRLAAAGFLPLLLVLLIDATRRSGGVGVVDAFTQPGKRADKLHGARYYDNNHGNSIISPTSAKINVASPASTKIRTTASLASSAYSTDGTKKLTTLTEDTTWRLRLLLDGVTTTKGRKLRGPTLFVLEGHFIEEEGYEPPQGIFRPIPRRRLNDDKEQQSTATAGTTTLDSEVDEAERVMSLELAGSRWKLSEDPNDPKDGLWVWGLFKEPLYPFLLLQMETRELVLEEKNGGDGDSGDSLPALKLYAQVSHVRSEKVEGDVVLSTANLNVRVLEQVKLPGATVDLFEEEVVGRVSFQPLP